MLASSVKIQTALTITATFLMGFLDAYTFSRGDGIFISAQTGNLIVLSVKLFSAEWTSTVYHIISFIGFCVGIFIGAANSSEKVDPRLFKARLFLLLQTALLAILALLQTHVRDAVLITTLGILAGYALVMFRKIGVTSVNNGVMTGNTKDLVSSFYNMIFSSVANARSDFHHLSATLVVFILGAGIGTLVAQWRSQYCLWFAAALSLLMFLLVTKAARLISINQAEQ